MSDNTVTEVPSELQGLDAIISSAINDPKHEEFFADEKPAAPVEAAAEEKPSRDRDEKGRFVSANPESTPEGAAKEEAPPAEPAIEPATKPLDPPQHFTADMKAKFAQLPVEAQQVVLDTEKTREADYTRRSQEHAEYKRTADPWMQAVNPYKDYLAQIAPSLGRTPEALVNEILATEHMLRNGQPAQRYQAFVHLARAYGVDLAALTRGQIPQQQPQQVVPQNNPVMQRLHRLEQLEAKRAAELEEQHSLQQITEFAIAKSDDGQPKYPHFERVRGVMSSLIMSGQAKSLEDAYSEAIRPIQDLIESEMAAKEKERQAALEKAKKAAPIRASTGSMPRGQTEAKGLSAHINAAMAKAGIS